MRLITGDECGLLKECIPERSSNPNNKGVNGDDDSHDRAPVASKNAMPYVSLNGVCRIDPDEIQSRGRGLVDLTFIDDDQQSFAALRQNGSIQLWEGEIETKKSFGKYRQLYSTTNIFGDIVDGPALAQKLKPLALGTFAKEGRFCAGDSFGNLSVVNIKNGDVIEKYNAYRTSKGSKIISYTPGNRVNTQLATAMACDPKNGRIAVGGRERETTVLDLATGKVIFKAKNLPPDPQTLLQHPVWPTSIMFLENGNTMAVGTAYKELRLYDVRESSKMRRPIARSTTDGGPIEYRVTSLCQIHDFELAVGDAAGYIYSVDTRILGKNSSAPGQSQNLGRYVGPAGSVRQLKKHPNLPRMAAIGLDRMLRVYDTGKKRQLDCFYLKQRLTTVLFGPDEDWRQGSSSAVEGSDGDQDINQDDVVQDYIDSDEDTGDEESGHSEIHDSEDELIRDGSDRDEGVDDHEQSHAQSFDEKMRSDDSPSQSVTEAGSDDDTPSVNTDDVDTVSDGNDDVDDVSDGSEEEIIIKAPTKKRRRR